MSMVFDLVLDTIEVNPRENNDPSCIYEMVGTITGKDENLPQYGG
jgi:hypothetical protein